MSVTSLTARRLGRDSAEAWLSKRDLARTLGFSARWVDRRVSEGMPCERFGARLRFQRGPCEACKRWQYRVVLDWGRQLYCAERPPGGPAGAATRMVPASLQRTVWFFADELRKARP